MEFPCPFCDQVFSNTDNLYTHALYEHTTRNLADLIRKGQQVRKLTKADFVQVDSQWIYAARGFHLSFARDDTGSFKMMIYGTLEPIPPSTAYPTEPEWDKALKLADKFIEALAVAEGL